MLIQTSLYPYVHRRNVQYPYRLCCIVELHVGWVVLVHTSSVFHARRSLHPQSTW